MRQVRRRVGTAAAMDYATRRGIYHRQNGSYSRLTPRQVRRLTHKANAGRSHG